MALALNISQSLVICMFAIVEFLKEKRAQSEWNSLYMLIVLIIVALVLITIIKPMFRQSQQLVKPIKSATSAVNAGK